MNNTNNNNRLPSLNRTARLLPQGKSAADRAGQEWAPYVGTDGHGTGAYLCSGKRGMVAPVVARAIDAWFAAGPMRTLAVIGHGVRMVVEGQTGVGAPAFMTAKDAQEGRAFLFHPAGVAAKDGGKLERVQAAKEDGLLVSYSVEKKGKGGGCTVTLNPDASGADVLAFLEGFGGSSRAPIGYRSDMGAPQDVQGVVTVADAPEAEAPKATMTAKERKAARKAARAAGADVPADAGEDSATA